VRARWAVLPDVDVLPAFGAARTADRFYWERPGEAVLALGRARAMEADGPGRFRAVERWRRSLAAELGLREGTPGGGALVVGGFAFAGAAPGRGWRGFPAARFVLPRLLAVRRAGALRVARFGRGGDPRVELEALLGRAAPAAVRGVADFRARADRAETAFRGSIATAVAAIRAGALEKVVVARSCSLRGARPFDPARVLAQLRAEHPGCTLFAVGRGGACFLGSSPERLVRLEVGGAVAADAVAGTAARGRGPEEDAARARALRESKKDQEEHAILVREVRAVLAAHCSQLEVPESPGLLSTGTVHHLHTPLRGRLRDRSRGVFDLADRLHPTPAVGGAPREAALRFLARHEGLDRGWYAGPVGWSGLDGSGELTVALRSALLRGRAARLFAGAGIVRDSIPGAELEETRLKLQGVLSPLLEI
jgi:isochorismate synthase